MMSRNLQAQGRGPLSDVSNANNHPSNNQAFGKPGQPVASKRAGTYGHVSIAVESRNPAYNPELVESSGYGPDFVESGHVELQVQQQQPPRAGRQLRSSTAATTYGYGPELVGSRNPSGHSELQVQQQPASRSGRQLRSSTASTSAETSNNAGYTPSDYQHSGKPDNIDKKDKNDPASAAAFVQDMYEVYRAKEAKTSVRPLYMESQMHINERMRSILVDWLVEVHLKFKLVPETLYLTINLIDRYLERMEVSRPKLQLVGVTSLLIAAKYEEIYPPELRDLVYICDRAYSKQEIIDMETKILKTLEYNITIPSAHAFLVRFLKAAHANKQIVQLACYILDGTLQSYNLLHYLPSQLAAASVWIARRTAERHPWSPTLLKYAEYCEEEVIPVAKAILAEKSSASPELRAVNKKYTSSRYGAVSNMSLSCDF